MSRRLKERYGALNSEAEKQVKRNARTDKRWYLDNLDSSRGRMSCSTPRTRHHLLEFRFTKQICEGPYDNDTPMKQTNKYADIRQRARNKMGRKFWRSAKHRQPIRSTTNRRITRGPGRQCRTMEEIVTAIMELKNVKALGRAILNRPIIVLHASLHIKRNKISA